MAKTLVVLLRGINVGGRHPVAMPALRTFVEGLGYTDVRTYINSGNLIVGTTKSAAAVAKELERALADEYGFEIPLMIRTPAQLAKLLDENPYSEGDPKQVTIAFTNGSVPAGARDGIAKLATDDEQFTVSAGEVFVDFAGGLGKSKLAANLNKAIGAPVTARNIRTVAKLVELTDGAP